MLSSKDMKQALVALYRNIITSNDNTKITRAVAIGAVPDIQAMIHCVHTADASTTTKYRQNISTNLPTTATASLDLIEAIRLFSLDAKRDPAMTFKAFLVQLFNIDKSCIL